MLQMNIQKSQHLNHQSDRAEKNVFRQNIHQNGQLQQIDQRRQKIPQKQPKERYARNMKKQDENEFQRLKSKLSFIIDKYHEEGEFASVSSYSKRLESREGGNISQSSFTVQSNRRHQDFEEQKQERQASVKIENKKNNYRKYLFYELQAPQKVIEKLQINNIKLSLPLPTPQKISTKSDQLLQVSPTNKQSKMVPTIDQPKQPQKYIEKIENTPPRIKTVFEKNQSQKQQQNEAQPQIKRYLQFNNNDKQDDSVELKTIKKEQIIRNQSFEESQQQNQKEQNDNEIDNNDRGYEQLQIITYETQKQISKEPERMLQNIKDQNNENLIYKIDQNEKMLKQSMEQQQADEEEQVSRVEDKDKDKDDGRGQIVGNTVVDQVEQRIKTIYLIVDEKQIQKLKQDQQAKDEQTIHQLKLEQIKKQVAEQQIIKAQIKQQYIKPEQLIFKEQSKRLLKPSQNIFFQQPLQQYPSPIPTPTSTHQNINQSPLKIQPQLLLYQQITHRRNPIIQQQNLLYSQHNKSRESNDPVEELPIQKHSVYQSAKSVGLQSSHSSGQDIVPQEIAKTNEELNRDYINIIEGAKKKKLQPAFIKKSQSKTQKNLLGNRMNNRLLTYLPDNQDNSSMSQMQAHSKDKQSYAIDSRTMNNPSHIQSIRKNIEFKIATRQKLKTQMSTNVSESEMDVDQHKILHMINKRQQIFQKRMKEQAKMNFDALLQPSFNNTHKSTPKIIENGFFHKSSASSALNLEQKSPQAHYIEVSNKIKKSMFQTALNFNTKNNRLPTISNDKKTRQHSQMQTIYKSQKQEKNKFLPPSKKGKLLIAEPELELYQQEKKIKQENKKGTISGGISNLLKHKKADHRIFKKNINLNQNEKFQRFKQLQQQFI